MKKYLHDMLYIISCAIHGHKAVLHTDMDIDNILLEAHGQSCLLWCISALLDAQGSKYFPFLSKHETVLLKKIDFERIRREKIYSLIDIFENNNLVPIIIKGECLAYLYPNPFLRESADTDIFFDNLELYNAAIDIVIKNGGEITSTTSSKHITLSYHGAGRIELHSKLYSADFHEMYLKNEDVISEPFEQMTIDGKIVHTLGINDSIKFIFAHMAYHFLFSRCDIRQICDILMYIKIYKQKIDKDELFRFLEHTDYKGLFDAIIGIGYEYLGFEENDLYDVEYSVSIVNMLLDDIFMGCTRGIWSNKKTPQSRGGGVFEVEINKRKFENSNNGLMKKIVHIFCPEREILFKQYPYCKKYKMFIGIAWMNNIFSVLSGSISVKMRVKRRMELLKKLKIIS